MLTLVTGTPGSGKSLWTIHQLREGRKNPKTGEPRPIYYYGIPGLSDSLGWIELQDPKNWPNEVPDGSIIVIDEVQEHFPVRSPKLSVPEGLTALERHRHRGLDLFFLTQHPSLLDHHARRLVGEHCHLKRNFGASFAVLYRANECMDNPKDYHTLKNAERTTFKYPKQTFDLYKSAEVHTHKFRLPKIFYVLIAVICFVIFCIVMGYQVLFAKDTQNTQATGTLNNLTNSPLSSLPNNSIPVSIKSFTPVIPNTPASSPYYSKQWKPKSVPIVSSCIGSINHCSCYTQQGTFISVEKSFCLTVLKTGIPFDHTLKDPRQSKNNHE